MFVFFMNGKDLRGLAGPVNINSIMNKKFPKLLHRKYSEFNPRVIERESEVGLVAHTSNVRDQNSRPARAR